MEQSSVTSRHLNDDFDTEVWMSGALNPHTPCNMYKIYVKNSFPTGLYTQVQVF